MFKDDYKNEIDKIKPDGYIKQKVLKNLKNGQKPKVLKFSRLGTAVAAVLCVAIVVSGIGISSQHAIKVTENESITLMKTVKSYDGIYKELEKLKPSFWENAQNRLNGFFFGFAKDSNAIDEEYEYAIGTTESTSDGGSSQETDHSETTTQVEGVDEADIVKTDGRFIYILTQNTGGTVIKIVDVKDGTPKQIESISASNMNNQEMYLMGDRLVILGTDYDGSKTTAIIYDVSDPENAKKIEECSQSGTYNTSRLIGNRLYIISDFYILINEIKKSDTSSFAPEISAKGYNDTLSPECIHIYDNCSSPTYTVVSAFNIENGEMLSSQSVLGGSYTVYASTSNIITTSMESGGITQIARFQLKGDEIKLAAAGSLEGSLLNQFSIDEYKDHFRFVLTDYNVSYKGNYTVTNSSVNSLVILDGDLKETGKITNIAPGERVYSVRFMGDTAYFVTFRQVDPLFSVEVSDPHNPKIIGALKIPGFSNYLFPYGDGKLLGLGRNADEYTGRTGSIKLSMFDISDPANVTESDKTDVNADYSAALYNHKAVLCDYNKNIISFAAYGYTANQTLYVYSYENGKFIIRLAEELGIDESIVRPLYIGNIFYIVSEDEVKYFDINTFEKIGSIILK